MECCYWDWAAPLSSAVAININSLYKKEKKKKVRRRIRLPSTNGKRYLNKVQQIETSDRKHTVRLTFRGRHESNWCWCDVFASGRISEIKCYRLNLTLIWSKLTDSRICNKYLSLNRDPEVVVVFRLELKLLKTQNHVLDFVVFCKTNR